MATTERPEPPNVGSDVDSAPEPEGTDGRTRWPKSSSPLIDAVAPAAPAPEPGHEADRDVEEAIRGGAYREALQLLMMRYGDRVLALAYTMLRDPSAADEVRQQVFVQAFRDFSRFQFRAPVRVWLFRIARNRALDAARARWRWTIRFTNVFQVEPLADRDPAELHDAETTRTAIEECLDRLAPAARLAVVQRYFEELSYEEAERQTGTRAGTLQRRVVRALPVLRKCLDFKLRRGAR